LEEALLFGGIMFLVISDLHADLYKAFVTVTEQGISSRLLQQIEVIREVKKIARRYRVSHIFFLGDLFNSQASTIDKFLYNSIFYMIQSLAEVAPLYLLVGNHDIVKQINIFTPFTSIPNVKVVERSETITVEGKKIDLVPWEGQWAAPHGDYCFGHFGIKGATINNNQTVFTVEEQVEPKSLFGYKLVMAGHFHTRQMVGENLYHIGAVMAQSFKDTTEDRGCWLVNPENDSLKFLPIVSPKFFTVEINNEQDMEEFQEQYGCQQTNDYFKLRIKTDGISIPDLFGNNVVIDYDFDIGVEESERIDTSNILNLAPIIEEFIRSSNTALNKDKLVKKALELLEV
jgi:DNA repair exonuclease SbcCD nuclease subunit